MLTFHLEWRLNLIISVENRQMAQPQGSMKKKKSVPLLVWPVFINYLLSGQ